VPSLVGLVKERARGVCLEMKNIELVLSTSSLLCRDFKEKYCAYRWERLAYDTRPSLIHKVKHS
jgi:hypothetical protein